MKLPFELSLHAMELAQDIESQTIIIKKINKKLLERFKEFNERGYNVFRITDGDKIDTIIIYFSDRSIILLDSNTGETEDINFENLLNTLKHWIIIDLENMGWYQENDGTWEKFSE